MTPALLEKEDPLLAEVFLFISSFFNSKVRSRGLPDHVTGPVRVVSIEGLDANM